MRFRGSRRKKASINGALRIYLMSLDGYCAATAGVRQQQWIKKKKNRKQEGAVRDGMTEAWWREKKVINNSKQVITEGQRDRETKKENERTLVPLGHSVYSIPPHTLIKPRLSHHFFHQTPPALFWGLSCFFFSFFASLPACFRLCLKALDAFLLGCERCGTSLLARMDILTGDRLWPLAYRNRGRVQPGVL